MSKEHPNIMDTNGSESSDAVSAIMSILENDDLGCDGNYGNAISEVRQATKGDDRSVFWWRLVVRVFMIIMALALTALTYLQLKRSETNEFRAAFESHSAVIISIAENELALHSEAMESLTSLFATYALATSVAGTSDWPYVTLPFNEFETHAEFITSFSQDGIVWMTPIVEDVVAWNTYRSNVSNINDEAMFSNMFVYNDNGTSLPVSGAGPFLPLHQVYPTPNTTIVESSIVNFDSSSDPYIKNTTTPAYNFDTLVLSGLLPSSVIRESYPDIIDGDEPVSMLVEPMYSSFDEDAEIVGYVQSIFKWKSFFSKFEGDPKPIICTVENTCGDFFAILIDDKSSTYIDSEYICDTQFHGLSGTAIIGIDDDITLEAAKEAGICIYSLTVYPTKEFRKHYNQRAAFCSSMVGLTMILMVGSFFAFDYFVRRRNEKVTKSAIQSTAIVTSMFPSNVRDRLYKDQEEIQKRRMKHGNLKTYLRDGGVGLPAGDGCSIRSKPLADLFTETTVMFADIAGFTAWSSVREPYQVFTLLETLYGAFDAIAKRRRIFKVETIGDCYVAVSGVPEPRSDHAMSMCKFADDVMSTMRILTSQMETSLGPDTSDLGLRIGLHSGPVTAGVLRGERARFQLFGDTMNTAARIEQTGIKNRIQISQATANYLVAGGKRNWIKLREDKIIAKGKGELVTYWLKVNSNKSDGKSSRSSDTGAEYSEYNGTKPMSISNSTRLSEKMNRLIDWNTDVLRRLLQQIMTNRLSSTLPSKLQTIADSPDVDEFLASSSKKPYDEVKEVITLPQSKKIRVIQNDESMIAVSPVVTEQLRKYVCNIASMYNHNEFHNFEHASHVTMSVTKLLSRIVAPVEVLDEYVSELGNTDLASTLHDHTYGITSDPLTQFACVFSALIHDVDHPGVPNAQLVTENDELATRYDSKSVAEQNSIDLSWNLLMTKEYKELRSAICATTDEFVRFRQLVVNAVMATDIMDKDLKNIRNMRWDKVFADEPMEAEQANLSQQCLLNQVNRKATIVIEHMIQASDVSHTMQHWHIYRKWNERFFFECYDAYEKGRSNVDPSDTWYQGELGFYDFYNIPLAKKLKDCGVFGVSSDEYLQYAISNRCEWEARGMEIVAEMKERAIMLEEKVTI